MSKERFLAFNDAIIAIIATIMVLEFKTPSGTSWSSLRQLAIPLLAFALSFFLILGVWYNHHELYKQVKHINHRTYYYNTIWLFVMSLFPFITGWVGANPSKFVPELLYIIICLLWILTFQLMRYELHKTNDVDPSLKQGFRLNRNLSLLVIVIALSIVWFWPPIGLVTVSYFVAWEAISMLAFNRGAGTR